jgi:glycosyltransferase involved in cell wall biosynthesis
MNFPKVSIMIPTYNQQKYIVRAIESALSQDYLNIEIVIVDDNSMDKTQAIVENYLCQKNDSRIRYFRNKENIGILRNYKKSLYNYTSGDWVINLDGDDFFIDPSFISDAVKLTLEDDSIVLIFGNYCEYYQNTEKTINIMNKNLPRIMSGEDFMMRYSKEEISFNHNSILYKRLNAIQIGFYWDEYEPRNDWESFLRLIINNRVGYLKNISAAWTQHESNETRRIDIKKYLNNFLLIKGIANYAKKNGFDEALLDRWIRNMLYRSTRGSCIGYIRNKDFQGAAVFLTYAYKESWILPFKVIFNPGLIIRSLLIVNPSLYTKVKTLVRKLSLH